MSVISQPGQVCRELFFIRSGLVRSFYREKDTEISACFMKENDWLLSIESFYEQTPAQRIFPGIGGYSKGMPLPVRKLQHTLQDHPALQHVERLLNPALLPRVEPAITSHPPATRQTQAGLAIASAP